TQYGINHYSTYSNTKANMAERVLLTLKRPLFRAFSFHGNYKWLDVLPDIVKTYNNTIHSTTGYKPRLVNSRNEKVILQNVYSNIKTVDPKPSKFRLNQPVRISRHRHVFAKSYTPNW